MAAGQRLFYANTRRNVFDPKVLHCFVSCKIYGDLDRRRPPCVPLAKFQVRCSIEYSEDCNIPELGPRGSGRRYSPPQSACAMIDVGYCALCRFLNAGNGGAIDALVWPAFCGPSRRFAALRNLVRYRGMVDLASRPPGRFMGSRPKRDAFCLNHCSAPERISVKFNRIPRCRHCRASTRQSMGRLHSHLAQNLSIAVHRHGCAGRARA